MQFRQHSTRRSTVLECKNCLRTSCLTCRRVRTPDGAYISITLVYHLSALQCRSRTSLALVSFSAAVSAAVIISLSARLSARVLRRSEFNPESAFVAKLKSRSACLSFSLAFFTAASVAYTVRSFWLSEQHLEHLQLV